MSRLIRSERGITTPGTLLVVAGVGALLAGSYVYSQGLIRVSVQEKHAGGDHIRFAVPGVVVPMAMAFVPAGRMGEHLPAEARAHLPVALAALAELKKLPDCTLVTVESRDERVKVAVRSGSLVVDVDSDDEEVHVTLPLHTIDSVMAKVAAAVERAGEQDSHLEADESI